MVKYYYIPVEHEALVAQMVDAWLAQSDTAFVCMTGDYLIVKNFEGIEWKASLVRDQARDFIKREMSFAGDDGYVDCYYLRGFILEGELTDFQKMVMSTLDPTPLEFDTADEIILYLQKL